MDLEQIKELITVMRKNKIKEIDLEQEGSKVRIVSSERAPRKPEPAPAAPPSVTYFAPPQMSESHHPAHPAPLPEPAPAAPAETTAPPAAEPVEAREEEDKGIEIHSPMVGTFYRAPSPDAPPYTEVGTVINDETVLCIVEAMKLMNEIKAEMRGKILKILVENAQPVEFGQPLFLVEPF